MILLKNCFWVMKPHYGSGNSAGSLENDLHGVDILIKGNRIAEIAPTITAPAGTTIIDASKHLVMPGMVNTHHHFYQTLTRNVPAVQNAKLFTWLVYLYEIWKGIDEEAVYLSSKLALAELAKTGCTLST
ncbi:MAG TPA: amidohydrolase family protein, partial [Spirochaetales bacterium]|nr:amidohydrolase family protein [Spirochaetales bacterium]